MKGSLPALIALISLLFVWGCSEDTQAHSPGEDSGGNVEEAGQIDDDETEDNGTDDAGESETEEGADSSDDPLTGLAPVAQDIVVAAGMNETIEIAFLATDVDSDLLTYEIVRFPARGTLGDVVGDRVIYVPNEGYTGEDTFTYQATDGVNGSNIATVKIRVGSPPAAEDISVTTRKNIPVVITFLATDTDSENLSYEIVNEPVYGTLWSVNGNKVIYTPGDDFTGEDSFVYKASDGESSSNTAMVRVKVNRPPVAKDVRVTTKKNLPIEISFKATDGDGDALTYLVVNQPAHGTLGEIEGDKVTYTPDGIYTGEDSFTYKVNDGLDDSNIGIVRVRMVGELKYVKCDAQGENDGTSWENAYKELRDALQAASQGTEIWVAKCPLTPYYPAPPNCSTPDRTKTFELQPYMALYGGFAGTEETLADRDPELNETILSGDIGCNNGSLESYHIVKGASQAILDGFTIKSSNANGAGEDGKGGGIYNNTVTGMTISNCTFRYTLALYGGGIYNYNSSITLNDVVFEDINLSQSNGGSGGGIYNVGGTLDVSNSTFQRVYAGYGGAIHNESNAAVTLSNCAFVQNSHVGGGSGAKGGGIYNSGNSSMSVTSCVFTENGGDIGGGIYNSDSQLEVTGSTFKGNAGSEKGAAIYNEGGNATITACEFSGNRLGEAGGGGGGAIYNKDSSPIISNCTFTGHYVWGNGGNVGAAIYNNNSSPTISGATTNGCVFSGNVSLKGSAIYNMNGSEPTITNCKFDTNAGTGGAIYNYQSAPKITGCKFEKNGTSGFGGAIYDEESMTVITACIFQENTMSTSGWTGGGGAIYTYNNSPGYPNILNSSFNKNKARWVGGALYNINTSPSINGCLFNQNESTDGQGGAIFNYNNSSPAITNSSFTFNKGSNGGAIYNKNTLDSLLIMGCTFDNNEAHYGGAIYNDISSPQIKNSVFTNNKRAGGGGIFNNLSSPTINGCTFENNTVSESGGAIWNNNLSSPQISNCLFSSNVAGSGGGIANYGLSITIISNSTFLSNKASNGGGIYNNNSLPTIIDCTFSGNSGSNAGGGIYCEYSQPAITNSTFTGNQAPVGGGLYNLRSTSTVMNCSFSGNTATGRGKDIYHYDDGGYSLVITNSILWEVSGALYWDGSNAPIVRFSNVHGYTGGTNNIDENPMFESDAYPYDLRLQVYSPCIDTGLTAVAPDHDIRGLPRPDSTSGLVDMGAYEMQ